MEPSGCHKIILILLLVTPGFGQEIQGPSVIRSGEAALFVITPAPQTGQVLDLVHNGGTWMSRIPTFQPLKEEGASFGVGVFSALTTWAPGSYFLEYGDIIKTIEILPREYIKETIPLDSDLTDIRTDDGEIRLAQTRELSELLLAWDPDFPTYQGAWIMPIQTEYRETSFFGDRRTYVYSDGTTAYSIHNGWDFAVETGTPIFTPASGQVVMAKDRVVTGNTVVLQTMPGVFILFYHLEELHVAEGDWLLKSQVLGTVGSTGLSTGPHLHYEVRVNGLPVDPISFYEGGLLDKIFLMDTLLGH